MAKGLVDKASEKIFGKKKEANLFVHSQRAGSGTIFEFEINDK